MVYVQQIKSGRLTVTSIVVRNPHLKSSQKLLDAGTILVDWGLAQCYTPASLSTYRGVRHLGAYDVVGPGAL